MEDIIKNINAKVFQMHRQRFRTAILVQLKIKASNMAPSVMQFLCMSLNILDEIFTDASNALGARAKMACR